MFGATLGYYVYYGRSLIRALRTGRWCVPGLVVDRSKQPVKFCFAVLSFWLILIILTLGSCVLLRALLSKALV